MPDAVTIEILDEEHCRASLKHLAVLLHETVHAGAVVGFVKPFPISEARTYWQSLPEAVAAGERVLFCAFTAGRLVGTVQLYLSPEPNAPHRGEVYKLLVTPTARRNGTGRALMEALEVEARRRGRSLLLLDTVAGGPGERLYRRLGWREIGAVPNHFVDPAQTSIYFSRALDGL
jgi:GNAT superfamily N-acetyltransferase